MEQSRVRIADIAEALGLSTATVSNVIHGKTEKISDETVKRVQQELERTGYIPNMAGILLARNNSRIIGVVVNDHAKYEGRVLEDGFVMSCLNALSREVNEKGYFLMIKTTAEIRDIPVFASMWNMDGLILMGFCAADYEVLRAQMHISFVVYDGYFEACSKVVNLGIDHYGGGCQAGWHFKELGHTKALCIADNAILRTGAGYFRIVAFSYLPMAASAVLSAWLRCKEHAAIPFLASMGAVAANTGLNYLLIFGKLGATAMGITGAAVLRRVQKGAW